MKIDVTIATYNEAHTIRRCLDHVFAAIPRKVLNKVIIVDNKSTDDTLRILKAYQQKNPIIRIVSHKGMLGSVRYRQAQECKTEYIVFVDSDVYLRQNWWKFMSRELKPETSWVLGALNTPFPASYKQYFYWLIKRVGAAAFSNTIVHRKTMLECTALKRMHLGEDSFVLTHIKHKGKRAVYVRQFVADHEPVAVDGLLKRNIRAGQSLRIKEGVSPALFCMLRSSISDARLFTEYCVEKKGFSLPLAGLLALSRMASLYGIFKRTLVRKV